MNKKRSTIDKVLIITLVSVAFYSIVIFLSDLQQILSITKEIEYNVLPIIIILSLSTMVFAGLRYHILLKGLDIDSTLSRSISISLMSQSMLATPGRIGNFIKCIILKRENNTSFSISLPSVIAEQMLEVLSITSILIVFSIWEDVIESKIMAVILMGVIGTSLLGLYNDTIFLKLYNTLQKIRYFRNILEKSKESRDGLKKIFSFHILVKVIPLSITSKLFQILTIFLIFKMFNIDLGFVLAGLIYNTALIIGVLSFIPGGIIVTDGSMISLIIKNGVNISVATVAVIMIRFFTLWFSVIIGFISLQLLNSKKNVLHSED